MGVQGMSRLALRGNKVLEELCAIDTVLSLCDMHFH